jgi:hypothetical protein
VLAVVICALLLYIFGFQTTVLNQLEAICTIEATLPIRTVIEEVVHEFTNGMENWSPWMPMPSVFEYVEHEGPLNPDLS